MNADKRHTLFKGFVVFQFNYWPLVWMFRTKQLNNRINSLHEKDFSLTHTQAPGWLTMLYWLRSAYVTSVPSLFLRSALCSFTLFDPRVLTGFK